MKFHISNLTTLCLLISSGCVAQKPQQDDSALPTQTQAKRVATPSPVVAAEPAVSTSPKARSIKFAVGKPIHGPALVFQYQQKLAAIRPRGGKPIVLREHWLEKDVYESHNWDFSPDGQRVAFVVYPQDNNFFGASDARWYVFTADYNTSQKVLLAAYGRQKVASDEYPEFGDVRFDATGRKLILIQQNPASDPSEPSPSFIAIYDRVTRKRIFDGRQFVEKLPQSATRKSLEASGFGAPAISSAGDDIVCLAAFDDGSDSNGEITPTQKIPPTQLVHFNLKAKTAEVVAELDDQFSVDRTVATSKEIRGIPPARVLRPQFAWHPTQRKFIFVGPASPTNPAVNLFGFDLKTHKMTRITKGPQSDFSPQWSLDGKQIYWIRGSVDPNKADANHIWRANADGSGATEILPQIMGITKIQLLPHLADWGRYRDIPIEPLAGADK